MSLPDCSFLSPRKPGLVNRLSQRILSQAIVLSEQCRQHQPDFSVAVNISPMLLSNEHFPAEIEQTLLDGNLPAGALVLEVTESTMVLNPSLATEVLTRLSIKGVRFSIDDFGMGHSSLVSLLRSPFAELKIDRFRRFSRLGLRTSWACALAEGIESRLTSEMMWEAGCDIEQGCFFGRPMKRHKVLDLVQPNTELGLGLLTDHSRGNRRRLSRSGDQLTGTTETREPTIIQSVNPT